MRLACLHFKFFRHIIPSKGKHQIIFVWKRKIPSEWIIPHHPKISPPIKSFKQMQPQVLLSEFYGIVIALPGGS